MSDKRPKDLIDAIEEIAAKKGNFQKVDEDYYLSFFELTPADLERLTIVMMLSHEKEVRRISAGRADADSIKAVGKFVVGSLRIMSFGLGTLDRLASFGITARVGPEPTPELVERLNTYWDEQSRSIEDTVGRSLAWLLAQQNRQTQLPI
jgi:hypothetical protein